MTGLPKNNLAGDYHRNHTMRIGPYSFPNNVALAPMAGVTDRPFRQLCRRLGAGLAATEMITSDTRLWGTAKTRRRLDHRGEGEPVIVQVAGADPEMIAEAARRSVAHGAQIVDINMGCPAKKVCNRLAGSALLKDEPLVVRILEAAVASVDVPVTLKIRTGWDPENRNAVRIAGLAQDIGIQALAVHGRTRQCRFGGQAEYGTIRAVCEAVDVPVFANGDIDSPEKAARVLALTGAAGIMIGRAAQGRPWVFREVVNYLQTGHKMASPTAAEVRDIMLDHLDNLYGFYGEEIGVRVARKHLSWYLKGRPGAAPFREKIVRVEAARAQRILVQHYFDKAPTEELAA
jgi:tRNA-dihydrouridine synthase B